VEQRYQRSQIQAAAHRYERQIGDGTRPVIGVNRYREENDELTVVPVVRTPLSRQRFQVARLKKFKQRNRKQSGPALDRLSDVVMSGGNVFGELINTVEHCSLGQITERLHHLVGRFRPTV
jgi:methylmalonyl-CoA mutase